MKVPTDYPKTLYLLQITDTSMYVVAAVVIYIYGGKDVKSPALSSTHPITAKVAYGIAIPTVRIPSAFSSVALPIPNLWWKIVIAGVINGHVAAKYIYVRIFRGTDHMHTHSLLSIASWLGISLILWVIAWIISEAIPVFNTLLSLIVSVAVSVCRACNKY